MITLKKLEYRDCDTIRKYFSEDNEKRIQCGCDLICDHVFGTTFLWRHYYNTKYAVVNDSLILQAENGGTDMFSFPMGGDVVSALRALREYAHSVGMALYFCFISESDLHYFHDAFEIVFESEEPDWSDYVYDREAISFFVGKHYHGQRNFLNRFRKMNPDSRFVPINDSNAVSVKNYIYEWYNKYSDGSLMSDAEELAVLELLDNWSCYKMIGGVAVSGDRIVGFTAGEVVDDTVFIHIEKAEHDLPGAYQFLSTEFLLSITNDRVHFVNREEDMGIPGLRTSKEALHPVKRLKKYTLYCC